MEISDDDRAVIAAQNREALQRWRGLSDDDRKTLAALLLSLQNARTPARDAVSRAGVRQPTSENVGTQHD